MFAAPSLIVAGAPWQPLLDALPGRSGRSVTREVMTGGWSRPLRRLAGVFLRPWVAVFLFNLVMVAWHVPALYDLAASNSAVHIWLEHGSFFAAGVLFWLQFIPSPPFRRQMSLLERVAALLATNVVMIMIAMSLSIFVNHSVYSVYGHVPGVSLPPFADQQIGAAILWVCGDFWALPTMIITIRMLLGDEGGVGTALERFLKRGSSRAAVRGWATRPSGPSGPSGPSARSVLSNRVVEPTPVSPVSPVSSVSPVSAARAAEAADAPPAVPEADSG